MGAKFKFFGIWSAIVLAAFVFGLFILSKSQAYNECVGHNGQHATEQRDSNNHPVIVPAIPKPTGVNLFFYCGGYFASENGDAITAISTGLLTAITFLLAFLAWDQSETGRSQLRGYVFAHPHEPHFSVGGKAVLDCKIKNWGVTPIRNMSVLSDGAVLEPNFGEFKITPPVEQEAPDQMLAPSGETFVSLSTTEIFTQQDMDAIIKKTKVLAFKGIIAYKDAFDIRRTTEFLFIWDGTTRGKDLKRIDHAAKGNKWT